MSVLTPGEVDRLLDEITDLARRLRGEYRWSHGLGFSRTATDDQVPGVTGPTDPTAGIVASTLRDQIRSQVDRAGELVGSAMSDLRGAATLLRKAQTRLDREPVGPTPTEFPRTATRADVAAAREAQTRRSDRDDGWGES